MYIIWHAQRWSALEFLELVYSYLPIRFLLTVPNIYIYRTFYNNSITLLPDYAFSGAPNLKVM